MQFSGVMFEWRGPAPHYFVAVPEERVDEVREVAADVTYGWGMIPVVVRIGTSEWETSLWPKDGGYLVPVRAFVRTAESLHEGDRLDLTVTVATRNGRAANGPTT